MPDGFHPRRRPEPSSRPDRRTAAGLALVERAARLFLDALPRRPRFEAAATALGVSPRDLEGAYAAAGLNPHDHLRRLRLARLHADLMAGGPATLAAAQTRWGFPAGSQTVLQDYRERYGCRPEQTLHGARCRQASPDLAIPGQSIPGRV